MIAIVLAVPLGIWAARSRTAEHGRYGRCWTSCRRCPAFVYLIPAIIFFSLGTVPAVIATIVFAMPVGVRMTELGIRQVDAELVEAADAFGTPPGRTLLRVQLPLALPTIMAGVNQVIMLALSMVVIGGMVGARGLGATVFGAISQVDIGLGFEGGIAVVILAIYLDRITGALGDQVSPLGRRALAKVRASAHGGFSVLRYRPRPVVGLSASSSWPWSPAAWACSPTTAPPAARPPRRRTSARARSSGSARSTGTSHRLGELVEAGAGRARLQGRGQAPTTPARPSPAWPAARSTT